jgi:hypothetical protein
MSPAVQGRHDSLLILRMNPHEKEKGLLIWAKAAGWRLCYRINAGIGQGVPRQLHAVEAGPGSKAGHTPDSFTALTDLHGDTYTRL